VLCIVPYIDLLNLSSQYRFLELIVLLDFGFDFVSHPDLVERYHVEDVGELTILTCGGSTLIGVALLAGVVFMISGSLKDFFVVK